MLYDDLEVIVFEGPRDAEELHIYGLGDVHVGAPGWDEELTLRKIDRILDDPVGYVHLCGDLMNNGLKNSKTNTYLEMLSPMEQKLWIVDNLAPLVPRIISAVPGNHEDRTTREVGLSPMYDIMAMWQIEDRYRENLALSVVRFGRQYDKCQNIYGGLTTHGSTRNKHAKFITGFDGIDYAISGHTHTPSYAARGKIRLDQQHHVARHVAYHEIVVDPGMPPSDYGLKKEYELKAPARMDYLILHKTRPNGRQRRAKSIDYVNIQL
jgi:predicted phosphodiesterase